MSDPAEKCSNCGARRDAHTPAENGGLDCPPRADGKVPMVVGQSSVSYAVDEVYTRDRIEWQNPKRDAVEVLQVAHECKGDEP